MNKKFKQDYNFIINKYEFSDKNYTNIYTNKNDIYVFLNDYDNMNVYSLYPEMITLQLKNKNIDLTKLFNNDNNIDKFKHRIKNMKNIFIKIKNKLDELEGKNKKNMEEYNKLKKKFEDKLIGKFFHYHITDFLRDKLKTDKITNAWLKSYEIVHKFELINKDINAFHICELPGAFIFSIEHFCKTNNYKYNWIAQSLNPYNKINRENKKGMYLPDKYNIVKQNSKKYDFGKDDTGDITNINNIKYYHEKYGKSKDLVTSDCGQDSSDDFYKQEKKLNKVYWSQFVCAIGLLKKGGNYFCKIFTIQTIKMIEYVFICSLLFEQVYITKPLTTRKNSGEIYLVCKNFLDINTDKYLEKFYDYIQNFDKTNIINLDLISEKFLDRINKCNEIMGKRRIININSLIFLINNMNFYTQYDEIKKYTDNIIKYYINYFIQYYKIKY